MRISKYEILDHYYYVSEEGVKQYYRDYKPKQFEIAESHVLGRTSKEDKVFEECDNAVAVVKKIDPTIGIIEDEYVPIADAVIVRTNATHESRRKKSMLNHQIVCGNPPQIPEDVEEKRRVDTEFIERMMEAWKILM